MGFKPKICKECGSEFTPKCGTQVYCSGPHFAICEACGEEFSYACSPKSRPRYCSQECINTGKQNTVQAKYGVNNVSELQSVKDKISAANSSDSVKTKRETTCIQRYGVDNVSKNPEVKARLSTIMQSEDYLRKRAETCMQRYGSTSPMQTDAVKARRAQTCLDRYGTCGHPHDEADFASMISDSSKVKNYLKFRCDPRSYIASNYDMIPTISQLRLDLGVTEIPIYELLIEYNCSDLITHDVSSMESEVAEFIHNIAPDAKICRNDRTVIKPYEIDIYLPEYGVGFECNPAAMHNSSVRDPWGNDPKHYKYHQNKSLEAKSVGITLFHIFGYEWYAKRSIIQSMIANLLHRNSNKLNARDTYVCEISASECKEFLNSNHRQGAISAPVRLGLRRKKTDELVSVMTFGHLRNSLGKRSEYTDATFELSRFCNLCNYSVRGSASKLFTYFIRTYNPDCVISFSDIAHTSGGLYSRLGFSQSSISDPSYVWSNIYDTKYYHRVRCQKHNLKNLLGDPNIDIEHSSEKEIMESHKFVRIYDSGVIRWIWTNEQSHENNKE